MANFVVPLGLWFDRLTTLSKVEGLAMTVLNDFLEAGSSLMISVQNVSKFFGPVKAIQNISFEINKGEVVGFLGPNGAGKTTMMRLITGFFPPSEGHVLVDGKTLIRSRPILRKKIGYLPENNPLYHEMTAEEFLTFVAKLKGISFWERKQAISKVADQCGLDSVFRRIIGKLSKGFQQRVGLAQALLGDPDLLVLDEPTNGLDPRQIIEIRVLIQALGRERTILLSTHILPEVKMTCKRILILNQGRLVASGTAEELEKDLRQSGEILLTARGSWQNHEDLFHGISGVLGIKLERDLNGERDYRIRCLKGKDVRSEIAKRVLESGFELLSLKAMETSLEEIFLQIVTKEIEEPVTC